MQSLVAWVKVTHKRTLRVVEVDADDEVGLAERLSVATGAGARPGARDGASSAGSRGA